jgi:hypothetical protein
MDPDSDLGGPKYVDSDSDPDLDPDRSFAILNLDPVDLLLMSLLDPDPGLFILNYGC